MKILFRTLFQLTFVSLISWGAYITWTDPHNAKFKGLCIFTLSLGLFAYGLFSIKENKLAGSLALVFSIALTAYGTNLIPLYALPIAALLILSRKQNFKPKGIKFIRGDR